MKFTGREETFLATVVVTRRLPELVGRTESGVVAMGIVRTLAPPAPESRGSGEAR